MLNLLKKRLHYTIDLHTLVRLILITETIVVLICCYFLIISCPTKILLIKLLNFDSEKKNTSAFIDKELRIHNVLDMSLSSTL